MRQWTLAVILIALASVTSCSDAQYDFDFSISPENSAVFKTTAKSCYNKQIEKDTGNPQDLDLAANFAQFQDVSFTYNPDDGSSLNLVIVSITIKFETSPIGNIVVSSDNLLALNSTWWQHGEAVVGGPELESKSTPGVLYTPATTIKVGCPLFLSSLPGGEGYQYTASVTVDGYTRDAAGNYIAPARSQSFLSITYQGD